jgi:hypothetical protein
VPIHDFGAVTEPRLEPLEQPARDFLTRTHRALTFIRLNSGSANSP